MPRFPHCTFAKAVLLLVCNICNGTSLALDWQRSQRSTSNNSASTQSVICNLTSQALIHTSYWSTRQHTLQLPRLCADDASMATITYHYNITCSTLHSCYVSSPFSNRQYLSYDDCLEVRGEIIRTVLCCIVYWSCAQSLAHLDKQGFVSLGPFHCA